MVKLFTPVEINKLCKMYNVNLKYIDDVKEAIECLIKNFYNEKYENFQFKYSFTEDSFLVEMICDDMKIGNSIENNLKVQEICMNNELIKTLQQICVEKDEENALLSDFKENKKSIYL